MMVGSDAMPIQDVGYVNHSFPKLDIEAKPLAAITGHMRSDLARCPHRLGFHHLMLVTAGRGIHRVDFENYQCEPGVVIHVRPGQIHQYCFEGAFEAHTVLFAPTFMLPQANAEWRSCAEAGFDSGSTANALRLDRSSMGSIRMAFAAVTEEYFRTDASPISRSILQHQLHVLLLQLARQSGGVYANGGGRHQHGTYKRFLALLELRFAETRSVRHYARELACSPKTLQRACFAAAGLSPKEVIERRVMLEAGRLLAHTTVSTGELAAKLGFTEPTNFVKFFRSHEGMTPTAYRDGLSWKPVH
jgi:AraC-like DNA-binding protein